MYVTYFPLCTFGGGQRKNHPQRPPIAAAMAVLLRRSSAAHVTRPITFTEPPVIASADPESTMSQTPIPRPLPAFDDEAAQDGLLCRVHSSRRAPEPGTIRPVFVMLHGIGMSHRYYDKLQLALIDHGDTLILDLPGFGGTPKPGRQLSVTEYAALIARTLDEEGAQECIIIGHSMGAQFATELAIIRPELVSHVVLVGPVTDTAHRSPIKHALMLTADTFVERPVTNLMVAISYAQCGIPWYLQELPVMLDYRLDDRISLVKCPVLIIRGTWDIIAGHDWCEKLSRNAPSGHLVEIPGQPHAAHRGGAAAITTAVLRLMRKHSTSPQPAATVGMVEPTPPTSRPTHSERSVRSDASQALVPMKFLELRSITVQDRQCRSYFIGHGTSSDRVEPVDGTPAPVFLLIHGIGMSHRYFRRLGASLSVYGDVHLIDLPGYGWTKRPAHATTNEATAELIGSLLEEADPSSCVVIGHSMGVQSATELAIQRPDLVSHLVLIGAAVDAKRRTVHQQALTLGVNSILEKPLLNFLQFLDVLRCGPRWYLAQLRQALSYPLERRLPLARQPVLVLRGSRDAVAGPTWSQRLARISVQGETGTISGVPHAAHHSAPHLVTAAITAFLHPNATQ